MAHPDDELSVAGWVRRLTQAGVEVSMAWTHATPTRELEARAAAARLGIPADNLFFLGGTDRRLCDEIETLLPRFAEVFGLVRPTRTVTTAFEQGHLDHDATNLMVNLTFDGEVFEVPLYHTYARILQRINVFADPEGEERIELSAAERQFKWEIVGLYPSQRIAFNLRLHELRQRLLFRELPCLFERMRLQPSLAFDRPALPDALAREVRQTRQWARWMETLARLDRGGLPLPARAKVLAPLPPR